MKRHWCQSCRGKGKILTKQTRLVHGAKKDYDVLVDCPGLLTEQLDTSKLPIGGQDRAAGEREDA